MNLFGFFIEYDFDFIPDKIRPRPAKMPAKSNQHGMLIQSQEKIKACNQRSNNKPNIFTPLFSWLVSCDHLIVRLVIFVPKLQAMGPVTRFDTIRKIQPSCSSSSSWLNRTFKIDGTLSHYSLWQSVVRENANLGWGNWPCCNRLFKEWG